jgi:predicted NodU family carbamoyl transferase
MGEPIANTLEDALRCFYTCGLDALIVEDALISKAPLAELGIDLD